MQRDRYGEVVPAVARIEQAVIVSLKLTREKDNEPTLNVGFDLFQYLRDPCKAKERANTEDGDHCIGRDLRRLRSASRSSLSDELRKFRIQLQLVIFG